MKRFLSLLMMILIVMVSAIASAADSPVSTTDQVASCIDNDVGSSVFTIDDYMPSRDISALQTQHNLEKLHSEMTYAIVNNMQSQNLAILILEGPMCKNKIPTLSTAVLKYNKNFEIILDTDTWDFLLAYHHTLIWFG